MKFNLPLIFDKIIEACVYSLFGLIPLILTPWNYELFEYNKMMAVYGLTVVALSSWILKSLSLKKLEIKRTPLDLFFLFFLGSQIISTLFSMDIHTSVWGYYSRFHQGLIASFCYFLLFLIVNANFPSQKIYQLIKVTLITGSLVAVYGLFEHFGIDKNLWVQDVQNRVFSTLGQPNWLAAYLAILLPISLGYGLSKITNIDQESLEITQNSKLPGLAKRSGAGKIQNNNLKVKTRGFSLKFYILHSTFYIFPVLFYLALLFTKSRSGMIGFWFANLTFCGLLFLFIKTKAQNLSEKKQLISSLLYLNIFYILISFIIGGASLGPLEKFTLPQLTNSTPSTLHATPSSGETSLESGVTESGDIRKIVWKGALAVFVAHPLVGTGVETFAYAYYQYRPAAHNLTSEWDFLYNKAHNEYLNFAATTGILGVGSYLLFIGVFIYWYIKRFFVEKPRLMANSQQPTANSQQLTANSQQLIAIGLFSGWLSILITNFFGFSVVLTGLFFYLIPAIIFAMDRETPADTKTLNNKITKQRNNEATKIFSNKGRNILIDLRISSYLSILISILTVLTSLFVLYQLAQMWRADTFFVKGYRLNRSNRFLEAYGDLTEAIKLNPYEPFYADEIAYSSAAIAVVLSREKNASESAVFKDQSIAYSQMVQTISPNNISFVKSSVKTYYILSEINPKYKEAAVLALQKAEKLAPTDPKIPYNLGIIFAKAGQTQLGLEKLQKAISLKPNYRDAYWALALLQKDSGKKAEAIKILQFVLDKINKDDVEIKEKLKEWEK